MGFGGYPYFFSQWFGGSGKLVEVGTARYARAAVKAWLQAHSDWLLILDNADDVSIVAELGLEHDAKVRHVHYPKSTTNHYGLATKP